MFHVSSCSKSLCSPCPGITNPLPAKLSQHDEDQLKFYNILAGNQQPVFMDRRYRHSEKHFSWIVYPDPNEGIIGEKKNSAPVTVEFVAVESVTCVFSKSGVPERNAFGFDNLFIYFQVHHNHMKPHSIRYMIPSYTEIYDCNINVMQKLSPKTAFEVLSCIFEQLQKFLT